MQLSGFSPEVDFHRTLQRCGPEGLRYKDVASLFSSLRFVIFLNNADFGEYVKRPLLALITVFMLALPVYSFAEIDAQIDNITVSPVDSGAAISFSVTNAFNKDIDEAINSGMDTSFTFRVKVERKRTVWFDRNEVDRSFKHTVQYDTLRDEYQITLEENNNAVERTKNVAVMKSLMSTCAAIALRPNAGFVKGEEYEILAKAELRTIKLPMGLDYLLIFVKLWDFETDWHTVIFSP